MKDKIALFVFTVLLLLTGCTPAKRDTGVNKEIERKVDELVRKMTLEEKLGQMNQISSWGNIEDMSNLVRKGQIGSILNEVEPARINAMQKVAMEESRLRIPLLIARDVIHGFKTIFPIPLGQAASFNPALAETGARVAAIETSSVGIRWTFAPMIDISRDPRWGRIAESFGEDVYLTSVMGAATVKGFQGDSLSDPTSIAACPKHFIGYGAAEGGRDYNSTNIPERQLRNVYLPPFEEAVKAGAATIMTSFNDNDGIPSTANAYLLKTVLRDEWKFDGFVVSDWASVTEMISHGFAADNAEAAMKAINAGVDMEMVSASYIGEAPGLVKEYKVKESDIDEAVRNILRIKFRLGLFDNPYVDVPQKEVFYAPAHLADAKEAAIQSVILLKNEKNTLPVSASVKTVLITGPMADAPYEQLGTWVFDGEKSHTITPLKAIREMMGNEVQIIYEPALAYSRDVNPAGVAKAVEAAKKADIILAFVGEESILSGEAHSMAGLDLQGNQSDLILSLAKTGKPLVTTVMAGRPLTIEKEVNASSAVLYSFHPGTMGGPALADLLWGKAVPSGKTPVTFPKMVGQIPMYYSHNTTGRPATRKEVLLKDIPVEAGQTSLGCTSFYLDAGFDPLYPFGYGLSYTTFEYSNIRLSASKLKKNDTMTIEFDLANTGQVAATEVAQLYVQDKVGSIARPVKELKRFARIELQAGEKKTVSFELPMSDLAFWNIDMKKEVEAGDFNLWVAGCSQSGTPVSFEVID